MAIPGEYGALPKGGQLWLIDNQHWYAVYFHNGATLAWHVPDTERLQAALGPNGGEPDQRLSRNEAERRGFAVYGTTAELRNRDEHPGEMIAAELARLAMTQPWVLEDEVQRKIVEAHYEGRAWTEEDLAQTSWWRERTDNERAWIRLQAFDPKTAAERLENNRAVVQNLLAEKGYRGAPDSLVRLYADRFTRGQLDERRLEIDIMREVDPYRPGASPFAGYYLQPGMQVVRNSGSAYIRYMGRDYELDGPGQRARYQADQAPEVAGVNKAGRALELFEQIGVKKEAQQLGGEQKVLDKVYELLGPALGAGYTGDWAARKAGELRVNPAAAESLEAELKRQFAAQFPNLADPTKGGLANSSYEDHAAPLRALYQKQTGRVANETDPFFAGLLGLNDMTSRVAAINQKALDEKNGTFALNALAGLAAESSRQAAPV